MIVRVVKMTFKEEQVSDFLEVFNTSCKKIRAFPGCKYLMLLEDKNSKNVIFTYSLWQSEEALDKYRDSELFINTWQKTKALFSAKPKAWSLSALKELV